MREMNENEMKWNTLTYILFNKQMLVIHKTKKDIKEMFEKCKA